MSGIWRPFAAIVTLAYVMHGLVPTLPDETDWERRASAPAAATMIQSPSSMYSISRELEPQLSAEALGIFNANLRQFAARMHNSGRQSEVGNTLSELSKLLSAPHTVASQEQRLQLVQEIMSQCAEPHVIRQGHHNTCAIAALESRFYTRSPSIPARVVRAVATAGRFKVGQGILVQVPASALQPDPEAELYSPRQERRTYASQLFQLAAANAYWQLQTQDPRGIKVPLGSIQYSQKAVLSETGDDTGERLMISWPGGTKETVVGSNGKSDYSPSFGLAQIMELNAILSGHREQDFLIATSGGSDDSRVVHVQSESALRRALEKATRKGQLPVILSVNLNSGVFGADQVRSHDGSADWHAVNISAYDTKSGTVTIDNWWSDRLSLRNYRSISVAELYPAM